MLEKKVLVSWAVPLAPVIVVVLLVGCQMVVKQSQEPQTELFDDQISTSAQQMMDEGRETFRFDTFGDEAFWGDTLQLHQAIAGEALGGTGPGVSPATALDVGLKVDVGALPQELITELA